MNKTLILTGWSKTVYMTAAAAARAAFGVDSTTHLLKPLNAEQQTYMAYHRDYVFRKGT